MPAPRDAGNASPTAVNDLYDVDEGDTLGYGSDVQPVGVVC